MVIVNLLGQVCTLGRAPHTKEALPDFHEWCRVTRHPRIFRGLTGCQRTPGFGASQVSGPKMENKLSRKNPYLLEHRRNPRKPRGHFLNSKPLISQTPRLDPRRNLAFSAPTHSPRICDEILFLTRRKSTN